MTAGLFGQLGHGRLRRQAGGGHEHAVGYMTQNDHLLPWRSVADNIARRLQIARQAEGRDGATDRRADRVGRALGFARSYRRSFLADAQARGARAPAAYDPDTLLMDEPFGALDAQLRALAGRAAAALQAVQQDRAVRHPRSRRGGGARRPRRRLLRPPGHDMRTLPVTLPADRDLFRLRSIRTSREFVPPVGNHGPGACRAVEDPQVAARHGLGLLTEQFDQQFALGPERRRLLAGLPGPGNCDLRK